MAKRVTSARNIQHQGGGGGGIVNSAPRNGESIVSRGFQQESIKTIEDLKDKVVRGMSVIFSPLEEEQVEQDPVSIYKERLEQLDKKFSAQRSHRRKGKKVDINVINDARIKPTERLSLFVKAAVNEGYSEDDAIQLGLEILEEKGDDIAGTGNNK